MIITGLFFDKSSCDQRRPHMGRVRLITVAAVALLFNLGISVAQAGDEDSKEELMSEVSFLAKKLLDLSGEDSITIESPVFKKPFVGVCSMINERGVKLTCITPKSQAEKHGLKTGDIITSINGQEMANKSDREKYEHPYWSVMHNMKTGDILKMEILRAGQQVDIDVTVGSLIAPAYVLQVNR